MPQSLIPPDFRAAAVSRIMPTTWVPHPVPFTVSVWSAFSETVKTTQLTAKAHRCDGEVMLPSTAEDKSQCLHVPVSLFSGRKTLRHVWHGFDTVSKGVPRESLTESNPFIHGPFVSLSPIPHSLSSTFWDHLPNKLLALNGLWWQDVYKGIQTKLKWFYFPANPTIKATNSLL